MPEAFSNGAVSTLNGAINNSQSTITIQSGDTSKFPASGNYRIAVTDNVNTELMLVTGGQGTATLTVTRAVEAFAGSATIFAFASGSQVVQVLTGAGFSQLVGLTTSNVTLTTTLTQAAADTWMDVLTLTLAAGTWIVYGQFTINANNTSVWEGRLWDGTSVVYVSSEQWWPQGYGSCPLFTVVTFTGSTTVHMQSVQHTSSTTRQVVPTTVWNPSGNNATFITAIKIG
jgi:hypothetical protein